MEYSDWVKRLGQWHLAEKGSIQGVTLCGRPMLGNNYAEMIEEDKREQCKECWKEV
jgi:hypothetical protein